jgi:hypothetical protein
MKQALLSRLVLISVAVVSLLPVALAQESVTIPKARFEELVRKEKELEKLKGDLSAAKGETARLKQEKDEAMAKAAAVVAATPNEPLITHVSPPLNSLPPLVEGETVDAMDLGNHYRTDAAAADTRYRKKVFKVKGEIVGFDKLLISRNYQVLLRTASEELRVLCAVTPPDKYSAVFTTKDGTQLTGAFPNGARVALTKVGDNAVIEGRCTGLDGSMVKLSGCRLLSVE